MMSQDQSGLVQVQINVDGRDLGSVSSEVTKLVDQARGTLPKGSSIIVRGQEVHLTPKEYDLLVYFISHPGKVLTHRVLLGAVWGGDYAEQTEYLRVFIGQLRKKIELDPAKPQYILTEPWIGYRFSPSA